MPQALLIFPASAPSGFQAFLKAYIHGHYRLNPKTGQRVWIESHTDKRPERHRASFDNTAHRVTHFQHYLGRNKTREALHAFHDLNHDAAHQLARHLGLAGDDKGKDKKALMESIHGRIQEKRRDLTRGPAKSTPATIAADFAKERAPALQAHQDRLTPDVAAEAFQNWWNANHDKYSAGMDIRQHMALVNDAKAQAWDALNGEIKRLDAADDKEHRDRVDASIAKTKAATEKGRQESARFAAEQEQARAKAKAERTQKEDSAEREWLPQEHHRLKSDTLSGHLSKDYRVAEIAKIEKRAKELGVNLPGQDQVSPPAAEPKVRLLLDTGKYQVGIMGGVPQSGGGSHKGFVTMLRMNGGQWEREGDGWAGSDTALVERIAEGRGAIRSFDPAHIKDDEMREKYHAHQSRLDAQAAAQRAERDKANAEHRRLAENEVQIAEHMAGVKKNRSEAPLKDRYGNPLGTAKGPRYGDFIAHKTPGKSTQGTWQVTHVPSGKPVNSKLRSAESARELAYRAHLSGAKWDGQGEEVPQDFMAKVGAAYRAHSDREPIRPAEPLRKSLLLYFPGRAA